MSTQQQQHLTLPIPSVSQSTSSSPSARHSSISSSNTHSTTPTSPSSTSSASKSTNPLQCQWSSCGTLLTSAESLYEHICEVHIGRKSTNNLTLTCAWGNCRTSTVKRDHITSHIRVHVPLKPHACSLCGKGFKRPQDLKKHVKTHAPDNDEEDEKERQRERERDERRFAPQAQSQRSAFTGVNSIPGGNYYNGGLGVPMMGMSSGLGVGNYYPSHSHSSGQGYYSSHAHPQPQPQTTGRQGYYNVYGRDAHPLSNSSGGVGTQTQTAPRDVNLNAFFANIKARSFDPSSYNDVANQLLPLQNYNLNSFGYDALEMFPELSIDHAQAAAVHGGAAHAQHAPQDLFAGLPSLNSKESLSTIENYLSEMHSATLDSATLSFPQSTHQSQAQTHNLSVQPFFRPGSSSSQTPPALTPSSASYTPSSASGSLSQSPNPFSSNAMYPVLTNEIPALNGSPMSTLGPQYDFDDSRRRWSGPLLQRAAPSSRSTLAISAVLNDDDEKESDKVQTRALASPTLSTTSSSTTSTARNSVSSTSSTGSARGPRTADELIKSVNPRIRNLRLLEGLSALVRDARRRLEVQEREREAQREVGSEGQGEVKYPSLVAA